MCGVSALHLAQAGFTGAPAITVEQDRPDLWQDFGERWYLKEQYYKPYPVCRWAQAPIEAALSLKTTYAIEAKDISEIEIATFHESRRLATQCPETTEEAQYSTSFPTAIALKYGTISPDHLTGDALHDPEVLRLSASMSFIEDAYANSAFPLRRYAKVKLTMQSGEVHQSDWHEPKWDHTSPPTAKELYTKFTQLADPEIGEQHAHDIKASIAAIDENPFSILADLITQ